MLWPTKLMHWFETKPLRISFAIGGFGVVLAIFLLLFHYTDWLVHLNHVKGIQAVKYAFDYVLLFGIALGAMNFNSHKLKSIFAIGLNAFSYLIK